MFWQTILTVVLHGSKLTVLTMSEQCSVSVFHWFELFRLTCAWFVFTADLKFSLTAETKAWMVVIGRHCNKKYRSEMENIFVVVEEFQKKLNRPIKDLDDIRIAMTALKEIREQQISIDFQVGPIEVDGQFVCYRNIATPWMPSAGVLTGSVLE